MSTPNLRMQLSTFCNSDFGLIWLSLNEFPIRQAHWKPQSNHLTLDHHLSIVDITKGEESLAAEQDALDTHDDEAAQLGLHLRKLCSSPSKADAQKVPCTVTVSEIPGHGGHGGHGIIEWPVPGLSVTLGLSTISRDIPDNNGTPQLDHSCPGMSLTILGLSPARPLTILGLSPARPLTHVHHRQYWDCPPCPGISQTIKVWTF